MNQEKYKNMTLSELKAEHNKIIAKLKDEFKKNDCKNFEGLKKQLAKQKSKV